MMSAILIVMKIEDHIRILITILIVMKLEVYNDQV